MSELIIYSWLAGPGSEPLDERKQGTPQEQPHQCKHNHSWSTAR